MNDDAGPITIEVLFFAVTREISGRERLTMVFDAPCAAAAALDDLCRRLPALAALRTTLRLAVNQEYVDGERLLVTGDELALIPPVCGG